MWSWFKRKKQKKIIKDDVLDVAKIHKNTLVNLQKANLVTSGLLDQLRMIKEDALIISGGSDE